MKNVILLYGKIATQLESILEEKYIVTIIDDFSAALDSTETPLKYQLLIIDKDELFQKNMQETELPLLVIDEDISYEDKLKIFSKNIKGTLEVSQGEKYLLEKIRQFLNYSNPYINTFRDNFIKAFIRYEKLDKSISSILYLTNYLIYHFKINNKLAADIRLVVIFIMIGYEKGKLLQIKHLIEDTNISKKIIKLFQNYENPKNLEETIVFCSLAVNFKEINALDIFQKMSQESFSEVFEIAIEATKKHIILIEKSFDVDIFWEKVSEILFSDKKLPYNENAYGISTLYKMVLRLFALYGSLEIMIENDESIGYTITISMLQKEMLTVAECKGFFAPICKKIDLSECYEINNNKFHIVFEYESVDKNVTEIIEDTTEEVVPQREKVKATVEKEVINTLHFEENQKMSAAQFVEEFGIDHDLLADMNESSSDTLDYISSEDGLDLAMLEKIANVFDFYARILNKTFEFEELAYALSVLARLVMNMDLTVINEVQIETLKQYIIGIIEDLSDWKEHIYVTQDTNDIHYLDASLLENASQIERFTTPDLEEEEDDDDDLEFF